MNLTMTRLQFRLDGVFSRLVDEAGDFVANTLEHSYECLPKLAVGTYMCQRGIHQLKGMSTPFETFEVMNVPDFDGKSVTGILFHVGNYNDDSEGCALLGTAISVEANGTQMIVNSRIAFASFMNIQEGVDQFTLVVQ